MTAPVCQLQMPNLTGFAEQILANAAVATDMAVSGDRAGKTLAICGAGPSLATARISPRVDEVWACNSALPYLLARGQRVTHGFCIDQGDAILAEWPDRYPVRYLLGSAVSPRLTAKVRGEGAAIEWFHSYLGLPDPEGWDTAREGESYEMRLYRTRFPTSVQVGHGLNSVPRAMCLAIARGYRKVLVYGADCGVAGGPPMPEYGTAAYADWMRHLVLYADGRPAATFGTDAIMAEAEIDGVRWHTRPDMVISARHMAELVRAEPRRFTLVGATLPGVLLRQSAAFLERMPTLSGAGQVRGFGHARPLEHAA